MSKTTRILSSINTSMACIRQRVLLLTMSVVRMFNGQKSDTVQNASGGSDSPAYVLGCSSTAIEEIAILEDRGEYLILFANSSYIDVSNRSHWALIDLVV